MHILALASSSVMEAHPHFRVVHDEALEAELKLYIFFFLATPDPDTPAYSGRRVSLPVFLDF